MVLSKEEHRKLQRELDIRIGNLRDMFESRELKTDSEGTKTGKWRYPERMCATVGSSSEIRLAIADFKAILTEIARRK